MASEFELDNGIMHCEDVALPMIAKQVGTPAYIYSTASMRRQTVALKTALQPVGDPLIAYAVKANPNAAILATFAAEGLGADVVSGGEYLRARAAGIAPEKIIENPACRVFLRPLESFGPCLRSNRAEHTSLARSPPAR